MATGVSKTKWNGDASTSSGSSAVTLSYNSKSASEEILATPPLQLPLIWGQEQAPSRLYYGDNLGVLSNLLSDKDVAGQVKLIYIDPPYATKSVFKSRNQKDAYQDLLGGADYVEFMRERLILMNQLLSDNGSIYVHLDSNMVFHIKILMDEIFGSRNFRNFITRQKCNPKNYTRKTFGNVCDYILFYSKTDSYTWNRPVVPLSEERVKTEYRYVEEKTGRRYMRVPVHAPGVRNGETGKPWRGMEPPPGKHWQYTPAKLDELDARGEIYWSPNGNPRRKVYLDENKGVGVQDLWLDSKDAHNQNIKITGYPTEKNPDLLSRIVQASSNPGDLVLDAFSGSGTTLAVSEQLNRNWIGIDSSPEAIRTTFIRFAHGTSPMGDFVKKKRASKALPLFDNSTETVQRSKNGRNHQVIKDFSFYALENDSEIQEILDS